MAELIYLLKCSLILENRDSVMVATDGYTRLIPMLNSLVKCINEMVSGPCIQNVKIVMEETPHLYFYPIYTRLIDD